MDCLGKALKKRQQQIYHVYQHATVINCTANVRFVICWVTASNFNLVSKLRGNDERFLTRRGSPTVPPHTSCLTLAQFWSTLRLNPTWYNTPEAFTAVWTSLIRSKFQSTGCPLMRKHSVRRKPSHKKRACQL